VIVLDNLAQSTTENLDKRAKFYEGDTRDFNFLDQLFKENKIDVVMHFAAKIIVPESLILPLDYYDNNVNGTLTLLRAMTANQIKNIIFSSTAAVYGMLDKDGATINELDPTNPINPYGETKLACEKMIAS